MKKADHIRTVDRMVWQKAWKAWKRLPRGVQVWIDPEDLYQEGLHTLYARFRRWDPKRGKFSTFAYTVLDNRFSTLVEHWSTQKRRPGKSVDVEVVDLEKQQAWKVDPPTIDQVILSWFT